MKGEFYSKVLHKAPRKPNLREDPNFGGVMVRGGGYKILIILVNELIKIMAARRVFRPHLKNIGQSLRLFHHCIAFNRIH